MKKMLVGLMIAATTMSMVVEVAAKPMGGSRSIGRQSPTVARQAPPPAAAPNAAAKAPAAGAPAAAGAAAAAPKPSMWKGMLGGALLGLGLGALLGSMGIGAGLASAISTILMIALLGLAAMFIWRMFKKKDTPANSAFTGFNRNDPLPAGATPEIGSRIQPAAFQPEMPAASASGAAAAVAAAPWGVPADFDTAAFLRHAKSSFIRMQAAWDKADVNDLREFTTPEVYAELKMQIQERGANADFTDVVSIDAELLGIETIGHEYLASVKFNGMISTAPKAPAEPFAEVWNMSKPTDGSSGWLLAGIQQLS